MEPFISRAMFHRWASMAPGWRVSVIPSWLTTNKHIILQDPSTGKQSFLEHLFIFYLTPYSWASLLKYIRPCITARRFIYKLSVHIFIVGLSIHVSECMAYLCLSLCVCVCLCAREHWDVSAYLTEIWLKTYLRFIVSIDLLDPKQYIWDN